MIHLLLDFFIFFFQYLLQNEFLAGYTILHEPVLRDAYPWYETQFLVLVQARLKALWVSDQEVGGIHHLLMGEKVELTMPLLMWEQD